MNSETKTEASSGAQPEKPVHNSAGTIVLQWLSYAFWGWLILALIWLMSVILANAITGEPVDAMVPYAMAATIVLLPIAFVTDFFYRKHEPLKKTGAAMVIMVIHAVIFALCGIGVLISAVFSGLAVFVNAPADTDVPVVVILTLGFATVLYAGAFLRMLNLFKTSKAAKWYSIGMLVLSLLLITLGVVGPFVSAIGLRDDRRIERQLSEVKTGVDRYASSHGKLPNELKDVEYSNDDTTALVRDDLIMYKKVGPITDATTDGKGFRYELCVEYKAKSRYSSYSTNGAEYQTSLYISGHPAGNVCYKLQTLITYN